MDECHRIVSEKRLQWAILYYYKSVPGEIFPSINFIKNRLLFSVPRSIKSSFSEKLQRKKVVSREHSSAKDQ